MTQTQKVDVAILGAGTAGLSARRVLDQENVEWCMFDDGPLGTTCARVGCMPSKLLIAAADAAHEARHLSQFGVHIDGDLRIDDGEVLGRVRRERDRFAGFVVESVTSLPEGRLIRERGRFVEPHVIEGSGGTRVEAKAVILATGSSPWMPPVLHGLGDALMVNDDVFELESLPGSVAVIGLGVIGLELGQALHRLGVDVHLLAHDEQVGPTRDPVVLHRVRDVLGNELRMTLAANIHHAEPVDGGVELRWTDGAGQEHAETYEKVLAATGRRPNLSGLGLEHLDLPTDANGVPIHDRRTAQCSRSHVFIAGDVANDRPLLHEAADDGRIAGANAVRLVRSGDDGVRTHLRRAGLAVVFSDPQIAVVGTPFPELPNGVAIGSATWDDQGRARVMGRNAGVVRVYADPEDSRIIGAEMFGPRVEHMAHLMAWAVQAKLTATDTLDMPFYHPVVEEGLRSALRDLAQHLGLRGQPEPRCLDCGPGA